VNKKGFAPAGNQDNRECRTVPYARMVLKSTGGRKSLNVRYGTVGTSEVKPPGEVKSLGEVRTRDGDNYLTYTVTSVVSVTSIVNVTSVVTGDRRHGDRGENY